ncbi:MAG: helix-hairpin-helix domain-containing protein [Bacteroidetes bacterium]|nr:helix-hairpin-helix domain-containing protein [Bacteroidota bacterium]
MNRLKAWIRNFFGFSQTEINAFLILLPLMFLLIFSEPVYRYWFVRQPQDFSTEIRELDSLMATLQWPRKDSLVQNNIPHQKMIRFNPNQVTKNELIQLGFNNVTASRLINYRSQGGKFYQRTDLLKIYGMDTLLYRKIYSYIDLPDQTLAKPNPRRIPQENIVTKKFNLNQADTTQLITVYGIGPKLSRRIISYREKLGGFISTNQLHEVYGLDSAVIQELKKNVFIENLYVPHQLDINQASEKELGQHPYIKYKLAKVIYTYRFQHGKFKSVEELKNISILDEPTFKKIKPYLTVNSDFGN